MADPDFSQPYLPFPDNFLCDPIPPFPKEINREHFASWLSGFTDGEGCFLLGLHRRKKVPDTPRAVFQIKLRADDGEVLRLIQSFFHCGNVSFADNPGKSGNHNPQYLFTVNSIRDLKMKIANHFICYPLLAKKSRDFEIWKEAVNIMYTNHMRPKKGILNKRGTYRKWSEDDFSYFNFLCQKLKEQRIYNDPRRRYD